MSASSRRLAPGLLWLLVAALALGMLVLGLPGSRSAASTDQVPTRPAADLVDSVGVAVHLGFLDTPYARTDAVVAALRDLGVRHVRDELRLDQPRQWQALQALGRAGIRSDLIVGPRPDQADLVDQQDPREHVAVLSRELAGTVASVEGLNEWDLWGGPTWARDVRAWQRGLYAAVKANPALSDVQVLAPAITWKRNWAAAGSFAELSDANNAHLYPDGRQPGGVLVDKRADFVKRHPDLPLVLTETGYHNATGPLSRETTWHPPVPEDVAATYLPRLLAGQLAAGTERTFLYELYDQFADPAKAVREDNFGLLRHDGSRKPAYVALRDLMRLASGGTAGPRAATSTDALGLAVRDAPGDLEQLVLQRPDGSSLVLLWRDVSVWDVGSRTRSPVAPVTVTLELDHSGPWSIHHPGDGPRPQRTGSGDEVPVPLAGRMAVVVVSPTT